MLQHKSTLKTILSEGVTTRFVLPDVQEVKTDARFAAKRGDRKTCLQSASLKARVSGMG